MSQRTRLLVVTLLILLWQTAMAGNACDGRASPTNPLANSTAMLKPGLGGTGLQAAAPGIGGTGMVAAAPGLGGTGIVGIITGFASICVNGIEVHYDTATPINENGQPGHASALAVGQVVVVNASGLGDEVQARQISLQHIAIGPVQNVQLSKSQFTLLGQTIQADQRVSLDKLVSGQWVRVSGQRNAEGVIQATHLQAVAPQQQAQLIGTLDHSNDGWKLNGTPITQAPASADQVFQAGAETLVKGHWNGLQLQAEHHAAEPTHRQMGAVSRVLVEGYVRAISNESVTIDHHVMTLSAQLQGSDAPASAKFALNQRVRISGNMDARQHISVERIEANTHSATLQKTQQEMIPERARAPNVPETGAKKSSESSGSAAGSTSTSRPDSSAKSGSSSESKSSSSSRSHGSGKSDSKH